MFKDEYRRHQEAVHAEEALIRRTLNAAARNKAQPRASWKPALVAALCVLLVAVPVALKLANTNDFTPLDAPPTPTATPAFVSREGTFQLQHISSSIVGETSYILLAAEGSGVSEKLTLDVQWTINDAETIWSQTLTPIEYSVNPPRTTYLLTADCAQEGLTTSDHLPLTLGDSVTMTLIRWWHATEDGSAPDITQDGETTLHFNMGGVGERRVSDGFVYEVLEDGTIMIEMVLWGSSNMVVPAKIDGRSVSSVGIAFYGIENLESITLPEGIKTVGSFTSCKNLKEVHLPEGLVEIMPRSFADCPSLESIHIPDSVTTIGSEAFTFCTSLKEVHLPAALTDLGYGAFEHTALEYVDIPDGLTSLPDFAFSSLYNPPKSVNIPASVTEIDWRAFMYGVSKVIVEPGSYAEDFARAMGYEYEYTAGSEPVPQYTSGDWVYTVQPDSTVRLESYNGANTQIIVPGTLEGRTVSSVGVCFARNSTITHVTLPEGMTDIAPMAFHECAALESIRLPESLVRIGPNAFVDCDALTACELPSGLQIIGTYAFNFCDVLRDIYVPASVTEIGEFAFTTNPSVVTLLVTPGSYAEAYAKENNLPHQLVEAE